MKILSVPQIREAERYTIEHEPISSLDLMERAASAAFEHLKTKYSETESFYIFCGIGNNGGDGFVIARMLLQNGFDVKVFWLCFTENVSPDCRTNYERLIRLNDSVVTILSVDDAAIIAEDNFMFPDAETDCIIIDAIFGSGLSRPVSEEYAPVFELINNSHHRIISIDMPSGLFGDISSDENTPIIKADETLTFQIPRLSFFFPDNYQYVGDFITFNIGLDKGYIDNANTDNLLINNRMYNAIRKPRKKFDHKGKFGHALLIAGSYDKCGAAILAAKGCMRSGVGLLTVDVPKSCQIALNISLPEAMCDSLDNPDLDFNKFTSIGIGPGIGTNEYALNKFEMLLSKCDENTKLVIDADGLNLLSQNKMLFDLLPENTILTPHPKEFARLFGEYPNDYERIIAQKELSAKYNVIIVYKTAHTSISMPDGRMYFNSTGNPGMATAGSGDVLTGMITGLLSRGYPPEDAAILGVYLHGLAGDKASVVVGQESLIASDIVSYL